MMVAFFSIFPFCGLIVGWIVCLLFIHFVRKKKDTTNYSIEINHFQRAYFILYTMLLIIIKGNFDKNVRAAIFVSVISVLNLLVYLLFLIANGFAHGEKTKKSSLPKWEKARKCLVIIYSVVLVVSTLLCFFIYVFATE
jgi:Ca2+/Na+ antiporter